jgi:hypothetical protein
VGTIDDLIVTTNEKVPYAVVSVGGFLGTDSKYVVVPYSLFVVHDKQMLLPGATKESLKSLPEFNYSSGPSVGSRACRCPSRRACRGQRHQRVN